MCTFAQFDGHICPCFLVSQKYMCPEKCRLFGSDVEIPHVAFNHYRIYGTILLLIIGACVLIGIKFVTKIAPLSLCAVLLSILAIYIGVIKSSFSPPDLL